ncbi:MAG: hypothetical protein K8T89_01825 [Planctomycetes bacterium]|nr:hypothetical protein [Planctomycetota bacterium]
MIFFRIILRSVVPLIALGITAAPAHAHRMMLEVKLKDQRLRVEAFYDDDTPAQLAKILVENAQKDIVVQGVTDEKGVWNCLIPASGEYTIRAEARDGHFAKERLTIPPTGTEISPALVPPSREETTQTPWLKMAIGLGLITLLFTTLWFFRRNAAPSAAA